MERTDSVLADSIEVSFRAVTDVMRETVLRVNGVVIRHQVVAIGFGEN